jgi:hypothetical protein
LQNIYTSVQGVTVGGGGTLDKMLHNDENMLSELGDDNVRVIIASNR